MRKHSIFTIIIVVLSLLFISCKYKDEKNRGSDRSNNDMNNLKNAKYFYNAIYGNHAEMVKEAILKGANPNYCNGDAGYIDSNPLNVLVRSFYDTYRMRKIIEILPNPEPDIEILNLLIKSGADINMRPYIWNRVTAYGNRFIDKIKIGIDVYGEPYTIYEIQEQINLFIEDSNRLLKALLAAGVNPDKLGHPYPYSYESIKDKLTEENINEYFAKGTRAINEAIKKGIVWESQVDLLLKYTTLDADSLKAAAESNDPVMIEKINHLWKEQQKRSVNR
jgi:hypothetical protein